MKLLIKIVAPVAVVITAAAITLAVTASADVYPVVPANPNPDVCRAERIEIQIQELQLAQARRELDRLRGLSTATPAQLNGAARIVAEAEIRVNSARYAEADCRNRMGNDPNKACITLALELNRLIDELPFRRTIEQIAAAEYARILPLPRSVIPAEELERARLAADVARLQREQTEARITAQRALIAATPACRDFPSERPELLPPPQEETSTTAEPTVPTSTSAS
jgi:hypothetical protein